ncbi:MULTISPECIES: hypothetical protein [Prauserella salsuginis group]|uniref:Uncharacterized protein n=1 Tax=Prauserella salsuginis TaxID=387889 RepID=A0ABW6G915_9PSEU|nr:MULTISPECIES: hypothetical protein [Prauserella salsuginis group]MCR3719415.1 hypothetical protein [Prauserella flava]MCR3735571.1 hypothetical protein [Prauserella salsuginis]
MTSRYSGLQLRRVNGVGRGLRRGRTTRQDEPVRAGRQDGAAEQERLGRPGGSVGDCGGGVPVVVLPDGVRPVAPGVR